VPVIGAVAIEMKASPGVRGAVVPCWACPYIGIAPVYIYCAAVVDIDIGITPPAVVDIDAIVGVIIDAVSHIFTVGAHLPAVTWPRDIGGTDV
jgi:hypothetical protein